MIYVSPIDGFLAKDAEEVQIGGRTALKFKIGSNRSRKNKDGSEVTDWIDILCYQTSLKQWLVQGKYVEVRGELESRPWTTQKGEISPGYQMLAHHVYFPPRVSDRDRSSHQQTQQAPQQAQRVPQAPQYQQAPQPQYQQPQPMPNSDLPF